MSSDASEPETSPPSLYLLLDANVLAGYYAPQTFTPNIADAGPRITGIIDSVRNGCSPQVKLLVPEICVAETQTVLSKHANPKWKGKTKKADAQSIHGKAYKGIVKQMREDLHGGRLLESIPLQRYHVLAKHLITPVDHQLHMKQRDGIKPVHALGAMDQLICGMAIWLTKLLGKDRLFLLTTDYRLSKVLEKARKVTENQAENWGIIDVANDIGFPWHADIYPHAVHLARVTEAALRELFGSWPLPQKKRKPLVKPRAVTETDLDLLIERYKALGIARDRLPYSEQMTALTKQFNEASGLQLAEGEVWRHLLARLKQGSGRLNGKPSAAATTATDSLP